MTKWHSTECIPWSLVSSFGSNIWKCGKILQAAKLLAQTITLPIHKKTEQVNKIILHIWTAFKYIDVQNMIGILEQSRVISIRTLSFSFLESILNLDFLAGYTSSIRVSMYLGFRNRSGFLSPSPAPLVALRNNRKKKKGKWQPQKKIK